LQLGTNERQRASLHQRHGRTRVRPHTGEAMCREAKSSSR
jgi:hypothetical protein